MRNSRAVRGRLSPASTLAGFQLCRRVLILRNSRLHIARFDKRNRIQVEVVRVSLLEFPGRRLIRSPPPFSQRHRPKNIMIWRTLSCMLIVYFLPSVEARVMARREAPLANNVTDDFRRSTPRIVNGNAESSPTVLAWQAVFLKNGRVKCGGSLISYNRILTAAHCEMPLSEGAYTVKIGAQDVANSGKEFRIIKLTNYFDFYRGSRKDPINDLQIAEIENEDKELGRRAVAINKDPGYPKSGSIYKVSGYGRVNHGGQVASHLRTASVPIVEYSKCKPAYADLIQKANICAGNEQYDSCQGDSGGALWNKTPVGLFRRNQSNFIVSYSGSANDQLIPGTTIYGVVSYGQGCARRGSPGVYVRLSSFSDWIQKHINMPPTPKAEQHFAANQAKKTAQQWIVVLAVTAGVIVLFLVVGIGSCIIIRRSRRLPKAPPSPVNFPSGEDSAEEDM